MDAPLALIRRLPRSVLGALVGFPIVVALYLMGVLTGVVPSPLLQVAAAVDLHARADAERLRLAQVTCINTAHAILDPARRETRIAACLPAYGAP